MADKEQRIRQLIKEHQLLEKTIRTVMEKHKTGEKILENWTIKEIIAHIAAWNWETIKEVDMVLQNKATWQRLTTGAQVNNFNRIEIEKRRNLSLKEVLEEWEESFQALIQRIMELSEKEWLHRSGQETWNDGAPLTVSSLFDYEYKGAEHEGGHAKQVLNWLSK